MYDWDSSERQSANNPFSCQSCLTRDKVRLCLNFSRGNNLELSHKNPMFALRTCRYKFIQLQIKFFNRLAWGGFSLVQALYLLNETCRPGKCGQTQWWRFGALISQFCLNSHSFSFVSIELHASCEQHAGHNSEIDSVQFHSAEYRFIYGLSRLRMARIQRIYIFINHRSVRNNHLFNSGL